MADGATPSYTITPNTGYHVDSVIVDGVNQGTVSNYDFTNVTANHSIAAFFSIATPVFLTPYNLFNLLRQTAQLGIISMAMTVLIVSGMLVGASGTLLTLLMAKAMNRSLANVLFSGFGEGAVVAGAGVPQLSAMMFTPSMNSEGSIPCRTALVSSASVTMVEAGVS